MMCNICGECHDEKTGKFLKHIQKNHTIENKSIYYYMSHDNDVCKICKVENKQIRSWNYEKYDTCENKICKTINSNNKKRNGQINLYKNGNGNFQNQNIIDKSKATRHQQYLDGTAYYQQAEVRSALSIKTTHRNLTNNPMKNKDTALKVSLSKTGVAQSASHRANIGAGLSKYLSNLSDDDFNRRMANTQKITDTDVAENILDKKTSINLNRWLENLDVCIDETAIILQAGREWLHQQQIQNFLAR